MSEERGVPGGRSRGQHSGPPGQGRAPWTHVGVGRSAQPPCHVACLLAIVRCSPGHGIAFPPYGASPALPSGCSWRGALSPLCAALLEGASGSPGLARPALWAVSVSVLVGEAHPMLSVLSDVGQHPGSTRFVQGALSPSADSRLGPSGCPLGGRVTPLRTSGLTGRPPPAACPAQQPDAPPLRGACSEPRAGLPQSGRTLKARASGTCSAQRHWTLRAPHPGSPRRLLSLRGRLLPVRHSSQWPDVTLEWPFLTTI